MKRVLLLLAVTGVVAAIGLAFLRRNHQPSYQGRSLDNWLRDYGDRPIGGGLTHDKFTMEGRQFGNHSPGEAIRAMGTNVIGPLLVEIKRPNDPPWADAAKRLLRKLPWPKLQLRDTQSRHEQAAVAFFDLGLAGITAIPELTQLLTNYSSSAFAAHALASMGTNAIPAFAAALTNSNTWVNDCGAWGLAQLGPASRALVPQILPLLKTGNSADNMLVLWALGEIREPVDLIRPELVSRLRHSDPQIRQFAARALRKLGPDAKPAEEEIKAALNNETDSDTRAALEQSLRVMTWNLEVGE